MAIGKATTQLDRESNKNVYNDTLIYTVNKPTKT